MPKKKTPPVPNPICFAGDPIIYTSQNTHYKTVKAKGKTHCLPDCLLNQTRSLFAIHAGHKNAYKIVVVDLM